MSNSAVSPTFSIIIPTHNRPHLLRLCIESVLCQNFPVDEYEVVVVDDGSRHPMQRLIKAPVRWLRQNQQGWAKARLAGAYVSRGRILAFLDDDCIAPPQWLSVYYHTYQAFPNVAGVAGSLQPTPRINIAGRKQYQGHLEYFRRLNEPLGTQIDKAGRVWFSFGGNRTFRREIWLKAQPKQTMWYADDFTIDEYLRSNEFIIYYEPAAWVQHRYHLTLAHRLRSAYRYGHSTVPLTAQPTSTKIQIQARWHELKQQFSETSVSERLWYILTQVLVRLACQAGQLRKRQVQEKKAR